MSKFFKGLIKKLTPKFLSRYQVEKPFSESLSKILTHIVEVIDNIVKIDDRLILIPFPSPEKTSVLTYYLNTNYGLNYLIFNLSDYIYSSEAFNNQVVDCSFPGLPCPPLEATFILLKQIDAWIESNPDHVVVLNSQANMSRSFMLAAEYLCFCKKKYKEPTEALAKLCEEHNIDQRTVFLPSQMLYVDYFSKILGGFVVHLADLVAGT
eukprot:TRINITY_DN9757_c0_g3_i2.p1 TRINITY_DN9757_c0_g3~~TRINITY_DN9757_c0_g3_i2.p1  ORF type:complete len:209 (-),score=39.68 TRINITY_DN9757_c0_g3_i2:452-1078(-)